MKADNRLNEIVTLVEQAGFLSVKELSRRFTISEVTIRRDLQRLHDERRLLRTYGGAAPLAHHARLRHAQPPVEQNDAEAATFIMEKIDALAVVPLNLPADVLMAARAQKHGIPMVAESLAMEGVETVVAVDNYQAGVSLGKWAGAKAQQELSAPIRILDLTYHLDNTKERSHGFVDGLRTVIPAAQVALSLNTQPDRQAAYRLTSDALQVYPQINIIFAINDTVARGALQACQELGIAPDAVWVLTFGLEGDLLKNALMRGEHLKAGLAMFPEIVGPLCIEALIDAYNGVPLPPQIVTPHAVLSPTSLATIYEQNGNYWGLRTEALDPAWLHYTQRTAAVRGVLPQSVGFLVPFGEHEWYINLAQAMKRHADELGIALYVVDAAKNLKGELNLRKLRIAEAAANLVHPGDVILIDSGQATAYLAELLADRSNITVVTNSLAVIDTLHTAPGVTLISSGGQFGSSSKSFAGPIAEAAFRELRVDKLFLTVSGASLSFGLSHTDLGEVSVKKAMMRAAHEVILLADHSKFEQEAVIQIAPINAINKLVSDNALPAGIRLDLSHLGVEVLIAEI